MKLLVCSFIVIFLGLGIPGYAQCDTIDLAFGHPAVTSSLENASYPASQAFDGDTSNTRWSSASSDPQYIYVDLGAVYNLCQVNLFWETALGANFTIQVSNDASTWTTVATITGNTSYKNQIGMAGSSGRYVMMYGTARGTGYGYSLYAFQVFGYPGSCNNNNLALNQTIYVSSTQGGFPGVNAVDGDFTTRWGSSFSDPQYIYADLGTTYNICQVKLYWENAYGAAYNIDISPDALTWTTMDSVHENVVSNNVIPVTGSGRYVRMYGLTRGTANGYSLYEFQIFGNIVLPITLVEFAATAGPNTSVLLTWETEEETNNKVFEVERSSDGAHFATIGEVPGAGNSSIPLHYQWIDPSPGQGLIYYRLLQLDLDGHSTYSNVVTIDRTAASNNSALTIFPNPATVQLFIRNPAGLAIREIQLYNAAGNQVATYSILTTAASVEIPMASLATGLYVLKITTTDRITVTKFLK
jgi:hypothetical protein